MKKLWRSRDASMNSRRWNNRPKGALEETERQGQRRWLVSRRGSGYVWKHWWMLSFLVSQVKVLGGTAWQSLRAQHWCIYRLINPPPPSHPRLRLTPVHWGSLVNNNLLQLSQSLGHFHSWLTAKSPSPPPPPAQTNQCTLFKLAPSTRPAKHIWEAGKIQTN